MPTNYPNLPSISLELLDGNLQIDQNVTGPVTLVIGRAHSGPSNVQYLVRDSNAASAIYGSGSPLLAKLSEAKLGGAQNIILYRIGGSAAELLGVFGEDSLLGTKEETSVSGSKYSVYVGPEPSNSAVACIIIFEGDKIVYSDVTGSEVDLGLFNIVGFDKETSEFISEYRIGDPQLPVVLEDALSSIKAESQLNQTGDDSTTTFDLVGGNNAVIRSATVNSVATTAYTISAGTGAGGVDQIVFDTAPASPDPIVVDYGVDAVAAGTGAGEYDFVAGSRNTETIEYSAGGNSLGCSWKEYYELLDQAYADLETTIATEVVVEKAILDAPNIADGSTDSDRLEYLLKEEDFGEVTYKWGTDKVLYKDGVGTTAVKADADLDSNGQPIIAEQYNEVNFVHQMGTWCHRITEDERFVLGAIGTSVPAANTTTVVAKWVGTLPQTDINGSIISNGSGLLGNRYMAGSTTQKDGFFYTDSGFPDGNTQTDSNGAPIDLGKYVSVVMAAIVTPDLGSIGSVSQVANASGIYAGMLGNVAPGESTTNVVVPRISLPFTLKKTKLDELSKIGYVSFQDKSRGVVVTSGELATNEDSDYDYVSTSIIVRSLIQAIRERLEPFIGKGLNQVTIAAAETAVEGIFQASVGAGAIEKYAFSVVTEPAINGRGRIRVPITIVPAFELREVSVSMKLAYDI